jgi:hypothetical protein
LILVGVMLDRDARALSFNRNCHAGGNNANGFFVVDGDLEAQLNNVCAPLIESAYLNNNLYLPNEFPSCWDFGCPTCRWNRKEGNTSVSFEVASNWDAAGVDRYSTSIRASMHMFYEKDQSFACIGTSGVELDLDAEVKLDFQTTELNQAVDASLGGFRRRRGGSEPDGLSRHHHRADRLAGRQDLRGNSALWA